MRANLANGIQLPVLLDCPATDSAIRARLIAEEISGDGHDWDLPKSDEGFYDIWALAILWLRR